MTYQPWLTIQNTRRADHARHDGQCIEQVRIRDRRKLQNAQEKWLKLNANSLPGAVFVYEGGTFLDDTLTIPDQTE